MGITGYSGFCIFLFFYRCVDVFRDRNNYVYICCGTDGFKICTYHF